MDVKIADSGTVVVSLSRRNLVDLLASLEASPEGARLVRMTGETLLFVLAEEDEKHYKGRTAGPGITYPGVKSFKEDKHV